MRVGLVVETSELSEKWIAELRRQLDSVAEIEFVGSWTISNPRGRSAVVARRLLESWKEFDLSRGNIEDPFARSPTTVERVFSGTETIGRYRLDAVIWLPRGQLPLPEVFGAQECWGLMFPYESTGSSEGEWSAWSRSAGEAHVSRRFTAVFRPNIVSIAANEATARWQAAEVLPRLLLRPVADDAPTCSLLPIHEADDWARLGKWLTRGIVERLRNRYSSAGRARWTIGVARAEDPAALCIAGAQLPFKRLPMPAGFAWADPFLLEVARRTYLFFEEIPRDASQGHISCGVLEDGVLVDVQPVLQRPYHTAYPFLFNWKGDHFMIPEASLSGAVEVYRATSFPTDWTLEAQWFAGEVAVDVTLAEFGGRWWLFSTVGRPQRYGYDEMLMVRHGPTPLGPWTDHGRNPVRIDAGSSRGAGRPFVHGDFLYRPVQDCRIRYGGAVRIMRVEQLNQGILTERAVRTIEPDWIPNLRGTHTFSFAGECMAVDGLLNEDLAR